MGVKSTSVLLNKGHYKAFMALDSCRSTERNGNRISADVTDGVNKNN